MHGLLRSSLAAATLVICQLDARAAIIDDFSLGAIDVVQGATAITQVQTGLDPTHVAGGGRRLRTGVGGGSAGQTIVVNTTARMMTLASGPTSLGYFLVEYGTETTPMGLDLAANGETHIEVVYKKTGIAGTSSTRPPQFFVFSPTGNNSLFFGTAVPLSGDSYLARAAFIDSPGVDFRNISRLTFGMGRYTQNAKLDVFSIKSVMIPEPTARLLLAAGAGLLSITARRR